MSDAVVLQAKEEGVVAKKSATPVTSAPQSTMTTSARRFRLLDLPSQVSESETHGVYVSIEAGLQLFVPKKGQW